MDFEVRVLRPNGSECFREDYTSWMDAIDRARAVANFNGHDVRVYSGGVLTAQWIDGARVVWRKAKV